MRLKLYVFDALYGSFSLAILLYAVHPIDEDTFLTHLTPITAGLAAALVLSALASALTPRLNGPTTLGHAVFGRRKADRATYAHLVVVAIASLYVSILVTGASFRELLDANGLRGAWNLWRGLSQPNARLIPRAIAQATQTMFIALLATVIAIPPAFIAAFGASKNLMTSSRGRIIYATLRILLNVARSVEPLIWALIFTVWVGVGPFAGMLALMIHSLASLTKYYSEIVEEVNEGPLDAIRATGASPVQVIWWALVPQVFLPFTAMTFYRWDTNVRMATVIGLVGGGGIGTMLLQYQGQAMWAEVGSIILVIAVIVWLMDFASAQIRRALK